MRSKTWPVLFWLLVASAGVLGILKPDTLTKIGGVAVVLFAIVMLYTKLATKTDRR
jgi:hypothetical protein